MTGRVVAGMDLGSTGIKLLVIDESGAELVVEEVSTPWRAGPGGTADIAAEDVVVAVTRLIHAAASRLAALTDARVEALGISGMGETGMLIDAEGRAVAPAFAWFDPRGAEQVAAFPAEIRAQFAGRTGLPLGPQVSVAKLAYLRDMGVELDGLRWLNLPEFVAMTLGGLPALEYSLTSRTGLLDQDTGAPWDALLAALGVTESFLPPLVAAGADLGQAASWLPDNFAGARLTVAGHDHLVAAEANGPIPDGHYHVSFGTAEVLLRVVDAPLGYAARTRLAGHLINEVRHIVPGKHVLVAGVKSGLLLRRTLQAVGIRDRAGRDRLDAAVMELPYDGALPSGGLEISGARNDDGVLAITVRTDDISPAEIFAAVLRHSNDEIEQLIAAMDRELPPATTATLTGGWAGMASVRRARAEVLPRLSVSSRAQETAFGAARIATRLLGAAHTVAGRATTFDPTERGEPMNELTTAEKRGMAAISTAASRMLIVAADQRNGMRAAMADAPGTVSDAELAAAKADLVRHLANNAPGHPARSGGRAARRRRRRHPGKGHRAGRRHGRVRLRDRRRPPLHPVRARRHRAPGARAGRRRREDAVLHPPGPAGRRTRRWPRRSASSSVNAPTRGSCSSSSSSPTSWRASPRTPTARRSPGSSPTARGWPSSAARRC